MTNNPKLSVAMAVYNSEKYIKAAIKSILRQTYKNWEIIFVEDKSTDDTLHVLKKYITKYSLQDKSQLFLHEHNEGYGTTLAEAIEKGSGEVVAVVDSDDALATKYAFSKMVEAHKANPGAALVYSTYYACRDNLNKGVIKDILTIPEGQTYLDALLNPGQRKNGKGRYCRVSHLKVFKRSCYDKTEGLQRGLLKAVDRDLVLKLEEHGTLVYINEPLYFHRKHDGNITNLWGKLSQKEKQHILTAKKQIIENAKIRRGLE